MEFIREFFDWFWLVNTDALIIPWVKANALALSMGLVVARWYVKKTPSSDDDELIDRISQVLPMMKRPPVK